MRGQPKHTEHGKCSLPGTFWELGPNPSVTSETLQLATAHLRSELQRAKPSEDQRVMLKPFRICCVTGGRSSEPSSLTWKRQTLGPRGPLKP